MLPKSSLIQGLKAFLPETTKLIEIVKEGGSLLGQTDSRVVVRRGLAEVTWVRETVAAVTFTHSGRLLKQDGMFHDYLGFMSAPKGVLDDFKSRCEYFHVTPESSLEITVRAVLLDRPTLGFERADGSGMRFYRAVPDNLWLAGDIPDDADFFALGWEMKKKLAPIVHNVADVWSSKLSDPENEEALANFMSIADAETRSVDKVVSRGRLEDGTHVFGDIL